MNNQELYHSFLLKILIVLVMLLFQFIFDLITDFFKVLYKLNGNAFYRLQTNVIFIYFSNYFIQVHFLINQPLYKNTQLSRIFFLSFILHFQATFEICLKNFIIFQLEFPLLGI